MAISIACSIPDQITAMSPIARKWRSLMIMDCSAMTDSKGAKAKRRAAKPDIELDADAWPKFERFIRDVAKAGPQHRMVPAPKPTGRPAGKGRVRKGKNRS